MGHYWPYLLDTVQRRRLSLRLLNRRRTHEQRNRLQWTWRKGKAVDRIVHVNPDGRGGGGGGGGGGGDARADARALPMACPRPNRSPRLLLKTAPKLAQPSPPGKAPIDEADTPKPPLHHHIVRPAFNVKDATPTKRRLVHLPRWTLSVPHRHDAGTHPSAPAEKAAVASSVPETPSQTDAFVPADDHLPAHPADGKVQHGPVARLASQTR
ncbi:hypothetical protein L249_6631 [Ophiocordyceps polyrhachis-furcata BCC 54312]|uniref:Uncharacterized protein n=1 Tax=Ophiocordyceps polyrhachis-furcata BCC 54312 TaxID=1330021 RepID=A0A367LLH7_9HYPO|nr:hypothetical protein L249_6631 [Ophiocordyceps polyrhachis-furcata BCC 54312]